MCPPPGLEPWTAAFTCRQPANDEHLWETILPSDVLARPEFWFGPEVQYISGAERAGKVTRRLRFAHLGRGDFQAAATIREAHRLASQTKEESNAA